MNDNKIMEITGVTTISQEQLLEHWQGHRRLTRRVIEAFPEDKLFTYSIGGMRPFSEIAKELISMAWTGVVGMESGKWNNFDLNNSDLNFPETKVGILQAWDQVTERINQYFPQIKPERFQEMDTAYGQYEGPIYSHFLYFVENEVHHRGQGYVYLRSLGIEPPYFWER